MRSRRFSSSRRLFSFFTPPVPALFYRNFLSQRHTVTTSRKKCIAVCVQERLCSCLYCNTFQHILNNHHFEFFCKKFFSHKTALPIVGLYVQLLGCSSKPVHFTFDWLVWFCYSYFFSNCLNIIMPIAI